MIVYLESSAGVKLMVHEPESLALRRYLDSLPVASELVSSLLFSTELRRAATRRGVDQSVVTGVVGGVQLLAADRDLFAVAGLLPGTHLRTLDVLHVATAVEAAADVMVAYDQRLIEAAGQLGLNTVSPS